jgi:hypothetical protein
MAPQIFLPRNLVNPFPSLQKRSSAYAHPLINNKKIDSKNITCPGAPVNNYLGFWGRMTPEWVIIPITIDAPEIGGKFITVLRLEEDRYRGDRRPFPGAFL